MKTLLRSTFRYEPSDDADLFLRNFFALQDSGLGFEVPEHSEIWELIREFVSAHNHVPDFQTIKSHFEREAQSDPKKDLIVDQVDQIAKVVVPITRGNFIRRLEEKADDRRYESLITLLKDTQRIASMGMEIVDGKNKTHLKGAQDAVRHFINAAIDITTPTLGSRLYGEVTADGEDFLKEVDRVMKDPSANIGQFTGIKQIDDPIRGAKKFELWTHAAWTGHLKCLAGDVRIFDLRSNKLRTIEEIYQSGDLPVVHVLDEDKWNIVPAEVSRVGTSGVRAIFTVTTTTGRNIRVSGNHPFRSPQGWVNADNLSEGDWVAIPANMDTPVSSSPYLDDEVAILGYLIGDGCLTKGNFSFTNTNPEIMGDFVRRLSNLGYKENTGGYSTFPAYKFVKSDSETVRISKSVGDTHHPWVSPLRTLLESLGLWGKPAIEKYIPGEVWAIEDRQVWILLSSLWSTDGAVNNFLRKREGRKTISQVNISYSTVSKRLADDVQLLLQRVGVPASICVCHAKYKGQRRRFYQISVNTRAGKIRFLRESKIIGKEGSSEGCLRLLPYEGEDDKMPSVLLRGLPEGAKAKSKSGDWYYACWAKKKQALTRDTVQRFAKASNNDDIRKKAFGPIRWERIKSIETGDQEMTYDLSVPGHKNFVANGFITHNSTFAINWGYNQAIYMGHSSLYYSLEMPYEQIRRIIYTMHSMHEKFNDIRVGLGIQADPKVPVSLDYSYIRYGELSDEEYEFLAKYVIPDMKDPANKYGKIHIEVCDPDKSDITVNDMKTRAELVYSKSPFSMIFIDHVLLVAPRKWVASTTERANEVVRDLKRLAMRFNRGMGMAVVALFQISRRGFEAAEKGDGRYNLTHLSYSNEIERSSDIVTATWIDDELRKKNRVLFQSLKARDGELFDSFLARVEWACRRILTCFDVQMVEEQKKYIGDSIDEYASIDDIV